MKIKAIIGIGIVAGFVMASPGYSAQIMTNTATVDSDILGPNLSSAATLNTFMQWDTVAAATYAPKGKAGAATNNPFGCIRAIGSLDDGLNHRTTTAQAEGLSTGTTCTYHSSSPQTDPAFGGVGIVNDATGVVTTSVPMNVLSTDGSFSLVGSINFTMDPATQTVTAFDSSITQNISNMDTTLPAAGGTQKGNQSAVMTTALANPAGFVSSTSPDEVADGTGAGRLNWTVGIEQNIQLDPAAVVFPAVNGQDTFILDASGTSNGQALTLVFDLPGFLP